MDFLNKIFYCMEILKYFDTISGLQLSSFIVWKVITTEAFSVWNLKVISLTTTLTLY